MPDTEEDVSSAPAFEALVHEVYEPLQRYLRRRAKAETAEDVLGDVLVVMWRRFDDIPPDAALPWCYGAARRCLANAVRSSERQLSLVRRIAAEPVSTAPDEDPELAQALSRLPQRDRELLWLWAWEQLSPAEIATVLEITPNAASIRLHRAIKRLKEVLVKGKDAPGPGHLVHRQGEEAT
jgi:RNA polymerase sigma-70 factor (ECF subfamily)